MQRPLEGIIPALHTAFDSNEELEPGAMQAVITRLVSEGVHGLFICGTSGEFPLLTLEERERIAELVCAEASGRVAIVVHVGAPRTRDAIRLAQHAARLGADALSSVPPLYYEHRRESLLEFVAEVAGSTTLPFLYYHIPERTGVDIDERFVEKLAAIPNVAGMKYSVGDLAAWNSFRDAAGPRFRMFCGSDEVLFQALTAGAAGGIGSTYNFLPGLNVDLWDAFREGKWPEAAAAQARAGKVIRALSSYPGIAASKVAVRLRLGIDLGQPRHPQSRLHSGEVEAIRRALEAH
jgi:N-acetylneuraminate lyase